MTWSPDHPAEFYDSKLAPRLVEIAAIAGGAVCRGLVELSMSVDITNGAIERYGRNKVILHGLDLPHSRETFTLSSFNTRVSCNVSRYVFSGASASTNLLLVPDLERPGELRTVRLREPGEEVIAIGEASPDTMIAMARLAAEAAGPLEQERLPWRLTGDSPGRDMFMVGSGHLVPVVGKLLQTIGNFAAQEAPEGLQVSASLKVDVRSSGRVHGPTAHTVQVKTGNAETGESTNFTMRFRFSGRDQDGEHSTVRCQLDRKDPNGEVTKDVLLQQGNQLVRVRSGSDSEGAGEYPANDQTILNMVTSAMWPARKL